MRDNYCNAFQMIAFTLEQMENNVCGKRRKFFFPPFPFLYAVEDWTYYGINHGEWVGGIPILCPEHISKTMLVTVMNFHG